MVLSTVATGKEPFFDLYNIFIALYSYFEPFHLFQ